MPPQTNGINYASHQYDFHRLFFDRTVCLPFTQYSLAVTMLKTNEMLVALLVGWNAVLVSSAESPAMSVSKANQYLSKGKTCVSRNLREPLITHETTRKR